MLTHPQIAFFTTFGYLHVPGYFAEEIGWIIDEFEAVWAQRSDLVHDGSARTIYPGFFITASPRLTTLLEHPKMVAVCNGLLGEGYGIQGGDGNFYAGDTAWHSDCGGDHWRWKTIVKHLKIAFYLDHLTASTGALRVIPGSHHWQDTYSRLIDTELQGDAHRRTLHLAGPDVPAVAVESRPGDLLCFDHRTKHASFGGSGRRRMFTTNWMQGARTPEMREAVLANYRFYRDDCQINWDYSGQWYDDPPAARVPILAQMKEFGRFVMREKRERLAREAMEKTGSAHAATPLSGSATSRD